MNLCSHKPLMGTGSEELFNTQTANYCVGFVNWLCPQFRTGAWWGWQIYGAVAHVHNTQRHIFFNFFFRYLSTVFTRIGMRKMWQRDGPHSTYNLDRVREMTPAVAMFTWCSSFHTWWDEKKQPCKKKNSRTISFVVVRKEKKKKKKSIRMDPQSSLVLYGNNCGWMFGSHGSHMTGRS